MFKTQRKVFDAQSVKTIDAKHHFHQEIKEFIINRDAMPSAKTSKPFTVIGDPGAMFTITDINEDIHYYNY